MKWKIKVEVFNSEKKALEIIDAFTWNGSSEDGITRAKEAAAAFGVDTRRIWAEKI